MSIFYRTTLLLVFSLSLSNASNISGEKVFTDYCWGCHHQTSVAFGPSFEEIANKRTIGEIQGHIIAPKSTYKQLGHKRSVMPSFKDKLSQDELTAITKFIMSYKSKKDK
ncbi:c-type cytochrome [Poseidonibacter lekithochrous]|uniref:c-type cytochrome n=1 Tax=Poseidonibacter lekithochrous TaxID=1904463 RepID=UPI0008FC4691|nr:cytochrome c [Poseidonibacter lekithochrous]QKJ21832.1 cytochrome c [Poseidonibacter lekithochrous]